MFCRKQNTSFFFFLSALFTPKTTHQTLNIFRSRRFRGVETRSFQGWFHFVLSFIIFFNRIAKMFCFCFTSMFFQKKKPNRSMSYMLIYSKNSEKWCVCMVLKGASRCNSSWYIGANKVLACKWWTATVLINGIQSMGIWPKGICLNSCLPLWAPVGFNGLSLPDELSGQTASYG